MSLDSSTPVLALGELYGHFEPGEDTSVLLPKLLVSKVLKCLGTDVFGYRTFNWIDPMHRARGLVRIRFMVGLLG